MSKRARRRPPVTLASSQLVTFAGAAAPVVEADTAAREVAGLVVPYGPAGQTSDGLLSFRPGSLTWSSDVTRVKLLRSHNQDAPLGHALELRDTERGLWGRFAVAVGPAGDEYLAEVADRRRDGLSVGVFLDAPTRQRLRRAQPGQVVAGSGVVRETSGVSVPAFDDARASLGRPAELAAANTGGLTRFDTSGDQPEPQPAAPAPVDPATGQPVQPTPVPTEPGQPTQPVPPAQPSTTTASSGPSVTRAAAGAAVVTGQPSTYGFGLDGRVRADAPSLVRDAFLASFGGYDERAEAHRRLDRFNSELATGNAATVELLLRAAGEDGLTRAAEVASPAERADFPLQGYLPQNVSRADLMLTAVNAGRPIASRLQRIPITNAQPFLVPQSGRFEGVGVHTEGTPHVAAGTLTLADSPVIPRAMSGAYVVSRELVDGSNPAIDTIAMREMLSNYRRESEGVVVTALMEAIDGADPIGVNVNTAIEMRVALMDFIDDDDQVADFVAASRTFLAALYAEVDGDGRPMIAGSGSTAPSVAGTARAGYTGIGIDGTELVRASRLDAGLALAIRRDGVLFLESNVQQFRFDEILGPGQIKLALWAYVGAAVLRAGDVGAIYTGAAPV